MDTLSEDLILVLIEYLQQTSEVSIVVFANVNVCYYRMARSHALSKTISKKLVFHDIAAEGSLELLKWAMYNNYHKFRPKTYYFPLVSKIWYSAIRHGYLDILIWLKSENHELNDTNDACCIAAKHGHLEILKWLRAHNYYWDRRTCACAAQNGHLEIIKWAHSNNCQRDIFMCYYAAKNGHLNILRWARANHYPLGFEAEELAKQKWPTEFS